MPNLATTIVQLRIATVVMVVAGKGSPQSLLWDDAGFNVRDAADGTLLFATSEW